MQETLLRRKTLRVLPVLLLMMVPGSAGADKTPEKMPTVAVMPFRDLSGSASPVGEAIRETVTTDLKKLSGVRVIERGQLDKILAEQKLQQGSTDLNPSTAARVGKLLGASLIVAGAYQKAAPMLRLTARFIGVETSEIIGTAKVDGKESEFLRLQDRLTAELLRSAGMLVQSRHVAARAVTRPQIKSLRTMALYGEALLAQSDDQKLALLQATLVEDAGFSYAVDDLAALERRMQRYEAQSDAQKQRNLEDQLKQLGTEKDPAKLALLQVQVLSLLQQSRRYHQMQALARTMVDSGQGTQIVPGQRIDEVAGFYLVLSHQWLKERDGLLRDGETYLKQFPGSVYFKSVQSMMEQAIAQKRREAEGRALAEQAVGAASSRQRWDLCYLGRMYGRHAQYCEAQRLFRACLEAGLARPSEVMRELIQYDIESGDFKSARKDLKDLQHEDEKTYHDVLRTSQGSLPADG